MLTWLKLGFFLIVLCLSSSLDLRAQENFYQNPVPSIQEISSALSSPSNDLNACLVIISEINPTLRSLRLSSFKRSDWFDPQHPDPKQRPQYWLSELRKLSWAIQMSLRDKFRDRQHPIADNQVQQLREFNRSLRFVRDYSTAFLQKLNRGSNEPLVFIGDDPVVTNANSIQDLGIRAGDILLTRGPTSVSATIGRIPDNKQDGQFSHLVFVAQDGSGELVAIESLIETGVQIIPLQEVLDRKSVRGAVFRHPNPTYAELAAQRMYRLVKDGPYIQYDFNGDRSHGLMCTGVAQKAYELAANEVRSLANAINDQVSLREVSIALPMYPSSLPNTPLVDDMGFKAGLSEFFAPSDMWFQPNFNLVGEWLYPQRLEEVLLYDAAMNKLFEWSDQQGYRLNPSFKTKIIGRLLRVVSIAWDILPSKLQHRIPRDMQYTTLIRAMTLMDVAEFFQNQLQVASREFINENGVPMTWIDAQEAMEQILRELEEDQSPILQRFRP